MKGLQDPGRLSARCSQHGARLPLNVRLQRQLRKQVSAAADLVRQPRLAGRYQRAVVVQAVVTEAPPQVHLRLL